MASMRAAVHGLKAEAEGLTVMTVADATQTADFVVMIGTRHTSITNLSRIDRPNLRPGQTFNVQSRF